MIYTNKHNLPEYICEWLKFDDYDYRPNTYSATTLMRPARITALLSNHNNEATVDYADLMASSYGTAIHKSLESIPNVDIQETRYTVDFLFEYNGELMSVEITGKPDMVVNGELHDFKSTSVWSYIYGSKNDDYIKQLSIYRYLLLCNGVAVNNIAYIDMFFTDWKKSDARRDTSYPQIRYAQKSFKLLSIDETKEYIAKRLTAILDAKKDLPLCSSDDLWQTETTFAVMKLENKRAVKVFSGDTAEKDANEMAETNKDYRVEKRLGKAKRCNYCLCTSFCSQYKELLDQGLVDE